MPHRLATIPFAAFLAAAALPALAEGSIRGQVLDAVGKAPLAGARLTLSAAGAPAARTTTSDDAGAYAFAGLPAGSYTLAAEANGFKPLERRDLPLRADRTLRVNLELLSEHLDRY